ncbi:MAG: Holliday junction branch migration protein RuvA [Chloroflexota bacterium]
MIAALRGTFRGRTDDGIILDVGGVGYEIVLPPIVEQSLGALAEGRALDLRIAYVATRDNPIPVLYGFARDEERKFWDLLRSVSRVGPKSAARAMVLPINRIAEAIRDQNTHLVDSLPGISAAGAEKIVATLRKKVGLFAELEEAAAPEAPPSGDELERLAVELLVEMGIRRPDARKAVVRLLKENDQLHAVEDIIMEYFKQ